MSIVVTMAGDGAVRPAEQYDGGAAGGLPGALRRAALPRRRTAHAETGAARRPGMLILRRRSGRLVTGIMNKNIEIRWNEADGCRGNKP